MAVLRTESETRAAVSSALYEAAGIATPSKNPDERIAIPKQFVDPTSPKHVVTEIEANAKTVNWEASQLSNRIEQFQAWLNSLAGRVKTQYWTCVDDLGNEFGMKLDRAGKEWALYYAFTHGDQAPDWFVLAEANIETKLRAIAMFPEFLKKMRDAQLDRAKEMAKATEQFDIFANAIGMKGEAK